MAAQVTVRIKVSTWRFRLACRVGWLMLLPLGLLRRWPFVAGLATLIVRGVVWAPRRFLFSVRPA